MIVYHLKISTFLIIRDLVIKTHPHDKFFLVIKDLDTKIPQQPTQYMIIEHLVTAGKFSLHLKFMSTQLTKQIRFHSLSQFH